MKKQISKTLALLCLIHSFALAGCSMGDGATLGKRRENVLRVASWDEYIDMGGEFLDKDDDADYIEWYKETFGVDLLETKPLYKEFEVWYEAQTGKKITVEYIPLQDNETMYGKIKMGDEYDLLCPSEYMIMKLAAENRLEKYPETFFDSSIPTNYYAQNVSPYIKTSFQNGKNEDGSSWWDYAAGYMWGSTGFVFDPQKIGKTEDESRKIMSKWSCVTSKECSRKITAKDNVRDSYFMGLGLYYEELLENGKLSREEFYNNLSNKMKATSENTMAKVQKCLEKMRNNLYGLETDEAKNEVIAGRLAASFQWSGDAVYIIDEAEASDNPLYLEYSVPESASNLWFDGFVMMKGANMQPATAFINFLSKPENVIRNMYYIGYTSCIGGDTVFSYVDEMYGNEEGDTQYPLSYFFGEGHEITTTVEQTRRQLFAQYPDENTIQRLVTMEYFKPKVNERANRMWNNIK